jgi:methyltransferase
MTAFPVFLLFLILQRIAELVLAKRNERRLKAEGAVEFDKKGYRVIVSMHVAFFLSLISERVLLGRGLNPYWLPLALLLISAEFLRYWAIYSLGVFWNTKVLVSPNHKIVTKGPYRYLRHPNYIAVAVEIAVIPLIFSCYITAVAFGFLNLILLRRRIGIEERVLRSIHT